MIKKLILMLLVLVGGVMTVQADNVTIFFKPLDVWKSSEAWFAIYLEDDSNNHDWKQFESVSDHEGIYSVSIPTTWTKFVLCRMNKATDLETMKNTGVWDGNVWNQCPNGNNRITVQARDAYYENQLEGSEWTSNYYNNSLVPWRYYFVSDVTNANWAIEAEMKETTGSHEYTFKGSDYQGKFFSIACGDQFWADGSKKDSFWSNVFRPTSTGNNDVEVTFSPDFAAYSITPVQSSSGSVWKMPLSVNDDEYVSISYNSSTLAITPYFTRTIKGAESNGKYYATFSSDYDVAVPTGITAYYAKQKSDDVIEMEKFGEGNGIASGDAAFLQLSSSGSEFTFTPASTTPSVTVGNMLMKPANGVTPAGAYVFANKSAGVGFYKTANALNNQQGKAYLSVQSQAPNLSIDIEGETTGIQVINLDTENTVNGQAYDLQGRRIDQPTKGLYIMNGKKYIVK